MSKVFTITEGLENLGALSTGGQGSVYKGKRVGTIITAVKIMPTPIHTESEDDKNFIKFKNEVEKLKKVNEVPNPNVVKILGSGLTESGSFPFIEMEYIEGPDLEKLLMPPHSPIFTIHEVIKLAEQLANALAHCHRVGIKHGDVKSNNVKFNTDTGNYVLLDFGLAIMSDEQRRTSLRHAGAVEFMAPEQHDGEMFFQTDIYSYGIILYELLAGTVPFPLINKNESSRNQVMVSHIEAAVPDLMALRRNRLPESWDLEKKKKEMHVPQWLLQVIHKCLEKNPEKRYANGAALQDAIIHRGGELVEAAKLVASPNSFYQKEVKPETPTSSDDISLSKPVFAIMILSIIILGMLSAYGLFMKNDGGNHQAVLDTAATAKVDTSSVVPEYHVDTTTQMQPVQIDTAAQKAEIDSLKKEYEAQMAASAKAAEAKAKETGPIIVSEGKKYQLPKGVVYFYEAANGNSPKNGVLGLWNNAKFNVIEEDNGFIYVTHTNKDGQVTKGWLNKNDLKEVKE
ncbi:MAG: serine/threonine-protein kinase [Candidatus Pedobacter colombiensis]|uniref:Serine/threonine-protein kinase n=1 Tax=Candidatus Pedobacter colombiensis TaxID=3121371 RepID=A0AAJ5WCT8_9SPHI|nr:serine/threonine-protein kinase [Pedobacter sp.]WEK21703.1 MAG: serine/threonine-protein kinase [Pedobacter sp.]